MLKYFFAWFPMLLLAIANGVLRELVLKKVTDESLAYQLSTILLFFIFAFYIGYVIKHYRPRSSKQANMIGVMWMLLTLAFEFGFGLARGKTWSQLLADYNILDGRIWIIIPLWLLVSPKLFYSARRRKGSSKML